MENLQGATSSTENIEGIKSIEDARIAKVIEGFCEKLPRMHICCPTWVTTGHDSSIPVAFDLGLTTERFYLENWQQLFDDGENFEPDQFSPLFGPYLSNFDDHIAEETQPCAGIEVRFREKVPEDAKNCDWKVLVFLYFAAPDDASETPELPELVIQDQMGNIFYWRTREIDVLKDFLE